MNFLMLPFIVSLILIGLLAAYFDIKKSVIPNDLVGFGYEVVVFLYLPLFLYNVFYLNSSYLHSYLPAAFLNGVISVVIGYLLWHFNFWSAGDGKLFGIYAFLLPLEFYSATYVSYFPSFVLLVNLFIPLIFYMFLNFLIYIFKEKKIIKIIKDTKFWEKDKLTSLAKSFLNIFFLLLFVVISLNYFISLSSRFAIEINNILIFAILITLVYLFNKISDKHPILSFIKYFVVLSYFGYLFSKSDYGHIVSYLKVALFFMVVIVLLKKVLLFYVKKQEVEKVKAKNIEEGAILTKEWRKLFSEKISKLTKNDKHKHFESVKAEGLTKKQAEIIRELFEDDPKYNVAVCNTLNFAPLLFFSAVVSLLTSSSLLVLINKLMQFVNI